MKPLIFCLVLLVAVCSCKKQAQPKETWISIGPDTSLVFPSDYTQFEKSFIGKNKFVDEAKIFLPGGVVILHLDDLFVWQRGAPKWAKYSKVSRWKVVSVSPTMFVMLDGTATEPEAYVEREGF